MFSSHKANILETAVFPWDYTSCHGDTVQLISYALRAVRWSMLSSERSATCLAVTAACYRLRGQNKSSVGYHYKLRQLLKLYFLFILTSIYGKQGIS